MKKLLGILVLSLLVLPVGAATLVPSAATPARVEVARPMVVADISQPISSPIKEVYFDSLRADTANVKSLTVGKATVSEFTAPLAGIDYLRAGIASAKELSADKFTAKGDSYFFGNIESEGSIESKSMASLKARFLTLDVAGVLTASDASVSNTFKSRVAVISDLTAPIAKIDDLRTTTTSVKSLTAGKATIDDLIAPVAAIDALRTSGANIKVLTAAQATITDLVSTGVVTQKLISTTASTDNLTVKRRVVTSDLEATGAVTLGAVSAANLKVNGPVTLGVIDQKREKLEFPARWGLQYINGADTYFYVGAFDLPVTSPVVSVIPVPNQITTDAAKGSKGKPIKVVVTLPSAESMGISETAKMFYVKLGAGNLEGLSSYDLKFEVKPDIVLVCLRGDRCGVSNIRLDVSRSVKVGSIIQVMYMDGEWSVL